MLKRQTLWDLYFPAWFREPVDRRVAEKSKQQQVQAFLDRKTIALDVGRVEYPDDGFSVAAHRRHITLVDPPTFHRLFDEIEAMVTDLRHWAWLVRTGQDDDPTVFRPTSKYTPRPAPPVLSAITAAAQTSDYTARDETKYYELVQQLESMGYWQRTWHGGLELVYAGWWRHSYGRFEIFDDDQERALRYDKQMTIEYRTLVQ